MCLILGLPALCACAPTEFSTLTLYESPHSFVRLEANHDLGKAERYSHPASVPVDRMTAVLRGIIVEAALTRMPVYDDLSVPRRHPAFTEEQVAFWAPLLSVALSKATAEEVVTFYQTRQISGVRREVTSGGLFIEGEELHFILTNVQAKTHTIADVGTPDTMDDRLTPLRPIAPQRGTVDFEPAQYGRPARSGGLIGGLFHWERRELIILVNRLPVDQPATPASLQ